MRLYQYETGTESAGGRGQGAVKASPLLPTRASRLAPRGFTLTELLVVITIIAILTSLITVAAVNAMRRAKQARITLEIQQISTAVENFKNEYGAYPPNGMHDTDDQYIESPNDFVRMFKKAFPRSREPKELIEALAGVNHSSSSFKVKSFPGGGRLARDANTGGMNGAEAIFFWLGGFSKDPKFPISGPGGPSFIDGNTQNLEDLASRESMFEFDLGRLGPRKEGGMFDDESGNSRHITYVIDLNGDNDTNDNGESRRINLWMYYPSSSQQPYGYFDTSRHRAQVQSGANFINNYDPPGGDTGNSIFMYAIKMRNETNPNRIEFANQGKFQLLHSGLDDIWGNGEIYFRLGAKGVAANTITLFPEGPFIGDIADMLTNFTTGTLEDAQE